MFGTYFCVDLSKYKAIHWFPLGYQEGTLLAPCSNLFSHRPDKTEGACQLHEMQGPKGS